MKVAEIIQRKGFFLKRLVIELRIYNVYSIHTVCVFQE